MMTQRGDVYVEKITGVSDSAAAYQPAASESTEEEVRNVPLIPT